MLKESIYHWCTRQVTTVYLLTDATLQSVPRLHWFVYFCVMFQQNVDGSDRQNLFFPALIVPKPYPSPKLTNEKHILGMSTSPRNDLYFPKQCRLSCSLSQTPLESTHFQLFLGPVKPLRRNSEIFQRLTHAHTDSRFFSKMLIIGV